MIHLSDHFPDNVVVSIDKFLVEYVDTEKQGLARIDIGIILLELQKANVEKQIADLKREAEVEHCEEYVQIQNVNRE